MRDIDRFFEVNGILGKEKGAVSLFVGRESDEAVLYFFGPGGAEFGQQEFKFDILFFEKCYEDSKFKRQTAKEDYLSFEQRFFDMKYEKANQYVRWIFRFFSISPSIIEKARCLSGRKKFKLSFKVGEVNKEIFGKCKPRGGRGGRGKSRLGEELQASYEVSEELKNFVKKSAVTFDLHFFDAFLQVYKEQFCACPYLSSKQIDTIFAFFVKKVDELQKMC